MIIRKAFKYRIYPTSTQKENIAKEFGAVRYVFNYYLKNRIDKYSQLGKNSTYYQDAMSLVKLKNTVEHNWLKNGYSQILQQSLIDLDKAYHNFFNKRANFPKFKKKNDKQSCRYPKGFKIKDEKLFLPKLGWVKIVIHRSIEGKIKYITISKTKSGKYFASIQVEQETEEPRYEGNKIGLDLGLKDFIVASDNQRVSAPKYFRKSEKKLAKLQKKFSRTKEDSNNREKSRIKVARQYEKITNQRKDFLHKLSRKLINENQVIVVEDLNVKGMVKNHKLAKSVSDAGWSEFIRQLNYKGNWYGCKIEKIDRFFPSSKRCFECGFIYQELILDQREWICPKCGNFVDRDLNAAKNILNWYTVGTTEINASGQNVRPSGSLVERGILPISERE